MPPLLSVVIPTLDAAATLGATLVALTAAPRETLAIEIVVADGGSSDDTVRLAQAHSATVVSGPRGRGPQLAAGVAATRGPWILALHADTVPEGIWWRVVGAFMARADPNADAAVLGFALDSPSPRARRLERLVAWRTAALGLPYGDQGLLIGRALYNRIGGYRPLPIMEDVDIVRRIGRRRLTVLPARAITSAARFERDGYVARSLRNLMCLGLWVCGVPARHLVRLYR
jgi:rSAM/selenodomain-associated transferase 2